MKREYTQRLNDYIQARLEEGCSVEETADFLNKAEIHTPRGRLWKRANLQAYIIRCGIPSPSSHKRRVSPVPEYKGVVPVPVLEAEGLIAPLPEPIVARAYPNGDEGLTVLLRSASAEDTRRILEFLRRANDASRN